MVQSHFSYGQFLYVTKFILHGKLQNKNKGVKVSKAFKQSVVRWLNLTTLRSREKHLNLLSHGGVLFLINPGTTIRYRAPPNPPTQPC